MAYTPNEELLEKYARVLVHYAVGHGKGLKRGETVLLCVPETAKPLLLALCRTITKAGGHYIITYEVADTTTDHLTADFVSLASPAQLDFFPKAYYEGLVASANHSITILADADPHALEHVDPKKFMRKMRALKPYRDMRDEKELAGKFSWTIALYGTPAMAKEAGLSERAYWQQIIRACYLDASDPVAEWKAVNAQLETYRKKLTALSPKIEKLHVQGADADLWITLGEQRRWLSGRGANVPSFEIFTSPDWRGTEGWIRFNQPLYYHGQLIEGVALTFKNGRVVKSAARRGERMLKEMIRTPNADRIGEFSMTDKRFSRITKFMAETLYDENIGGPQGNSHLALGAAYADTYSGKLAELTKARKEALGFNDSVVHTDIITTTKRTVTAHLRDGSTKLLYANGQYQW